MESGAEDVILPESEPEQYLYRAAERFGCPTDNETLMMECLREPSWEEIYYNTTLFGRKYAFNYNLPAWF